MYYRFKYFDMGSQRQELLGYAPGVPAVYYIFNKLNGHDYVGSTGNLTERFNSYYSNSRLLRGATVGNSLICRALLKYGFDSFFVVVLELCNQCDTCSILSLEQFWIDSLAPYYNICLTAGSTKGILRTQEFKNKQRENNTGQGNPMFGRAGESSPRFGILHTEESRIKMGSKLIYVFDASTNQLIAKYLGMREASRELRMSDHTIRKYIASGLPYNGKIFSKSPTI
jgi:group I intron endonuclease